MLLLSILLFALDVALKARLSDEDGLTLAAYFSNFGFDDVDVGLFNWYISKNICPMNVSNLKKNSTFLRFFLDDENALDLTILMYNIPQYAGCNLAFLVRGPADSTRLVAIQVKNENASQLSETLLTLHPATQYLQNHCREMLIAGVSPWRRYQLQLTPHPACLADHADFLSDPRTPMALKVWIGVGMVAVGVDANLKQMLVKRALATNLEDIMVCVSMQSQVNTGRSKISNGWDFVCGTKKPLTWARGSGYLYPPSVSMADLLDCCMRIFVFCGRRRPRRTE